MKRTKKEKRRLALYFLAILALSFFLITSVTGNIGKIVDNKKELKELETYYEELIKEEESLKSEVTKLSDKDYLARYAKEKYLYSKDGEIIIRFD